MSSPSPQTVPAQAGEPPFAELEAAVAAAMPSTIAELASLVRIPSVSWDGYDPARVDASAEAVAELARATGAFDDVTVSRAPLPSGAGLGQPAVLATRAARAGRPTVLLYAHHDVQPPGRAEDWSSAPFEPTLRGGRLYGRGAADDKAGVLTHLAAIRALDSVLGGELELGLVLFVEGEEEFGSRSFGAFLRQHERELAADVIVVADSLNWSVDTPALTVGLRGNVTFRLRVETLGHASHSGMFGGAVPDAMLAAIRLLDTFWDADGAVAIEGLRSHAPDAPDHGAIDYPESQLREESALLDGVSPIGRGSIPSRLWNQPAVTVTGIDAPSVRDASNTLQPAVTVKVSVRVAPGQPAAEALDAIRAHIEANTPFGARAQLSDVDTGNPFLVDTNGWAVADALESMRRAWGADPVQMGVGGSIPFISQLAETFPAAQILVTGVEDPDSRAHSPDESLHLGVFRRGIVAEALLLARVAERGVESPV